MLLRCRQSHLLLLYGYSKRISNRLDHLRSKLSPSLFEPRHGQLWNEQNAKIDRHQSVLPPGNYHE